MPEKNDVSVLATRLPARVFEAVRESARANDRSIASELRRTIVRAYTNTASAPR